MAPLPNQNNNANSNPQPKTRSVSQYGMGKADDRYRPRNRLENPSDHLRQSTDRDKQKPIDYLTPMRVRRGKEQSN